ncbi:MFS transporter [Pseudomaricurvus alkylphenolicus]|uniref:MFS transporter n=1 Tax=Pseudomaricurvus alkylphenolicus TaxID=1306991 RepID=UPI0014225513|nr:MFS transporter [Pseudomaricurvus alkylphenolicus]NIB43598.1 MFS transporter [Pseudomaricurvus alkylphenolicus]
MSIPIGSKQLLLFALPAMVSAVMHGPITGIVPSLYAEEFGLDLTIIGTVLLIARLFDAITDPLIGYMSDRTRTPFGKRKPWIAVGSAMTVVAVYFLYTPGESASMAYFLGFSLLLYLAWTVLEIPYVAWALELSRDSAQRAKINASRSGATLLGGIVFTLMPSLVPGSGGSMNFQVLGVIAIIMAVAIPVSTILALLFVPHGETDEDQEEPRIRELWGSIKLNKPFQYFIALYLCIGLGGGFTGVLTFMYVDTYLQIGDRYTELFMPSVILAPLSLPFWVWWLTRFDKYKATAGAFSIFALTMPVAWFIDPGEGAFWPMMIYYSVLSIFFPLLMVSMPTILGDIIDYDEYKTGKNRSGQYYAFMALINKGTSAIGGPLALMLIGIWGYQPGAVTNSPEAITGLKIGFCILPTLLFLPGLLLLWKFPMNDRSHRQIRSQLDERLAAAA